MRHNEFVKWLEGTILEGTSPKGSVEIVRTDRIPIFKEQDSTLLRVCADSQHMAYVQQ